MNPMSRCIWQKKQDFVDFVCWFKSLGPKYIAWSAWWHQCSHGFSATQDISGDFGNQNSLFGSVLILPFGKNHRDKYPDKYSDARLRIHDLWTAWQILTPFFGDKTTITSQNKCNDPWHSGHSRTFRKPSPEIFRERTPILALADMASHVAGRVKNVNIQISETMMSIEDHWSR